MMHHFKQFWILALMLGGMVVSFGCATTKPYVSNDTGREIAMSPSEFHQFKYVRVYEDDGEVVLYGKIAHTHAYCENGEHVDLISVDAKGTVLFNASLALRKQSQRLRGWYGAAFRTRIDRAALGNGSIRLAFHDTGCHRDLTFDCGDNQAKANAVGSIPASVGIQ